MCLNIKGIRMVIYMGVSCMTGHEPILYFVFVCCIIYLSNVNSTCHVLSRLWDYFTCNFYILLVLMPIIILSIYCILQCII